MFKKLKNLFVVSDEEFKNHENSSEEIQTSPVSSSNNQIDDDTLPSPTPISGSADPKFLDILLGSIEKNNMDGFDYLEFKQSLQNLQNLDMDESTKYNSAIAMAKTMGANTDSITNSASHYLKVLKTEEEKFKKALVGQQQKINSDKTTGINQLEQQIKSKEEQIEKLKTDIEKYRNSLEEMKSKIDASTAKLQTTNSQFSHAYKMIVQQIVDDVNNIKKYVN